MEIKLLLYFLLQNLSIFGFPKVICKIKSSHNDVTLFEYS